MKDQFFYSMEKGLLDGLGLVSSVWKLLVDTYWMRLELLRL